MRKVQDALIKLAGRAADKRPLKPARLTIPSQQTAGADSFPTSPNQVSAWLDQHRPFDRPRNIQALTSAIQHSNRLINNPADRLQNMSLFEAPAKWALAVLGSRIQARRQPLHTAAANAFSEACKLRTEMAHGYKIVLQATTADVALSDQQRETAIARTIGHLADLCIEHAQSHRQWPEHTWQDLHTLYALAREANCADQSQADNTSITSIYLKLCTLAISDLHRLAPAQMLSLADYLDSWSPTLIAPDDPSAALSPTCYLTLLNSDEPPVAARFAKRGTADSVLLFDLQPLLAQLDTLLLPSSTTRTRTEQALLHRSTLNRLHQIWHGSTRRQLPRTATASDVTLESGLRNLHAVMAHLTPSTEPVASDLNQIDIHHFIDQQNQPDHRPADSAALADEYGSQWIINNNNRRGMGLTWAGGGHCHMQVGDLTGHGYRSHNGKMQWHLGVCRWLHSDSAGTLRCGIESISSCAIAVASAPLTDEPGGVTDEAILLNHDSRASGPAMLLLAPARYRIGDTIHLISGNHKNEVTLAEKINLTAAFDCFGVRQQTPS